MYPRVANLVLKCDVNLGGAARLGDALHVIFKIFFGELRKSDALLPLRLGHASGGERLALDLIQRHTCATVKLLATGRAARASVRPLGREFLVTYLARQLMHDTLC